jgi:hypothetical protein
MSTALALPEPLFRPLPLDAAESIPLTAAGREPLFFFGTLMDEEILARILDRPLEKADLEPAVLGGYRREAARGCNYPLLVPSDGESVPGRLFRGATRRDIARINHYESGEYGAELHKVQGRDGRWRSAWVYIGLDDTFTASGQPWDLQSWSAAHKSSFLRECDGWMADFRE